MKKVSINSVYYLCVFCMAILMPFGITSCSNDEFAEYKYENDGIKSFTSFTATIGEEAITRAYLGDAGVEGKKRMYWNKGDEIAVFSDADSDFKTFKVTSVSSDNKATIQGEKISGTAFYGYYPNRDGNLSLDNDNPKLLHASLSANDFDEGENTQTPMVAISNSRNLAFKQVTGMIHVSIGGIYRLEKVTLSGNDNEVLYGNGTIDLSVDEPMFKLDNNQDANKSLGGTIRQGDEQLLGDGVAEIYFSLPPMSLAKGFTLEIRGYDESGKSIVFEKSTEASVVIKRALISHYTLENVMEELNAQGNDGIIEFADENVKAICIENWDTNKDGELSYEEAAAVTDIGKKFGGSSIKSFDEFQYFTGLTIIYGCTRLNYNSNDSGYGFFGCSSLTSIVIPKGVTTIGFYAFEGCSNLTNIVIPNNVTRIRNYAFSGTNLQSVTIGSGVLSIDGFAFSSPSKVIWLTNTPPSAYTNAAGRINYVPNDQYSSLSNIIIYPSIFEVDGIKYVPISPSDNICAVIDYTPGKSLEHISLDKVSCQGVTWTVDQVNPYAFYGCNYIQTVSLGKNITSIGDFAFWGCSSLKSVSIEDREDDSVLSFGSNGTSPLFSSCPLDVVYIGRNITYNTSWDYGYSPFYNNTSLRTVIIGNNVTSIGSGAFYNTNLKSVTIGAGVLSIASNAFAYDRDKGSKPVKVIWLTNTPPSEYKNAAGIVNYVANDQYTSLSNKTVYPFLSSMFEVDGVKYVPVSPSERTCDAIDCAYDETAEHINIGETVSYMGVDMKVNQIHPYTCYNNTYIKDAKLSFNGDVSDYAFYNCSNMLTTTLGKNITSLGGYAFSGCSMLESIVIPDAVESMGEYVFQRCSSMKSAKIGSGVTVIPTYAFSGCSSLTDLQIGKNVETINTYSFSSCSSLATISIPQAVTSIKNYVFSGCSSLKNVTMEDREDDVALSLDSNGSSPLFADSPLDEVYIGRNISYNTSSSYGYSPFYRNTSLRSVTITDRETEISPNEFYGCTNLKNVTIGDGVTTIGNWAFSGCSSLDYFAFGSALETIGQEAFSDCVNVTKIISRAATPPVCSSQALDDINKWNCTLQVPANSKTQYQAAEQWKEFFFIE